MRTIIDSIVHSFIHSVNHSLPCSVGCLLVHPLTRLFRSIHLFSLSHLLNKCFFLFLPPLTRSSTHSFIHSIIHPFTHLLIHSLIPSFNRSFIHSFIHSLIHSFTHFIHTLQSWLSSKAAIARENTSAFRE